MKTLIVLTIAAASNLTGVFGTIGPQFEQATGIHPVFSFGATANLAVQIENGAPFDVFAAADAVHVDQLAKKRLLSAGSRAIYATGILALWIPPGARAKVERLEDLANPDVKTIAVAKPELAPYGAASVETLKSMGLWQRVEPKIVYSDSISMARQYGTSGNADAVFTAYSLVMKDGGRVIQVPARAHQPIFQALGSWRPPNIRPKRESSRIFCCAGRAERSWRRTGTGLTDNRSSMDRVLSTHLICNHRLTTSWLGRVEAAGISAVEIFCVPQHLNYNDKSQINDLGYWFRDSRLKLHAVHAPMYTDEVWGRSGPHTHINITDRNKADRIRWVGEIKRALEMAETVPYRYLVQHIGVGGQEYSERAVEAAFSSLEELTVFAGQRGVEILLENTQNELSSATRLTEFNQMTHLNLNYVFDAGHANMAAGVEHEFEIMKSRIRSLHLHDNDGKTDMHLFPMCGPPGTIDWQHTMTLLRSRPDQYPLLLELKEVPAMENPIAEVARIFDALEALESSQPTHA